MASKQKQNYQIKPLMYIVQPDNQDIDVHMQSFVVKKVRPKAAVRTESVDSGVKKIVNESIQKEKTLEEIPEEIPDEIKSNEDVQSVQEIQENQVEQRQEQSVKEYRKQRKPLTQMNVAEKVEFFTNLPKNMPRTLCQIETTDENYRGVIMSEEDGIVTIRSLTHAKPIDLPVANIIAINLLGF
ncbi:CotO family spore coat protein [Metabacillus litoralis]|uniref:CotO family spore coat protein n=1 Tax=Metabacillus litoralis TaxID=152268 RepID=UPI00203F5FC6|nr:CotO family spore coat protein [Metabacillus litoralis]MCM3651261.1 spore coat CotO family protein [Metabacillus litoralis]